MPTYYGTTAAGTSATTIGGTTIGGWIPASAYNYDYQLAGPTYKTFIEYGGKIRPFDNVKPKPAPRPEPEPEPETCTEEELLEFLKS